MTPQDVNPSELDIIVITRDQDGNLVIGVVVHGKKLYNPSLGVFLLLIDK